MAVTMAQIARSLGVSKNTVSLALRNDRQISPEMRARVFAAARDSGYTVNPLVSSLMAELRKGQTRQSRYTLGIVNAYRTSDALRNHPTIPTYIDGCRRRAASQGYGLDFFWMHEPELTGRQLDRMLFTRGIRGLIIVGTMDDPKLPEAFASTWESHACVVTGVRTHAPTLPYCSVDHHALVLEGVERALALGYRRPALVIDGRIDRLLEGRFSSGMWVAQQSLPAMDRVPGFYEIAASRNDPKGFHAWLDREKPDVLFTLYRYVKELVEKRGLRVPRDIGLVQLEYRPDTSEWAGMNQHNDLVGEAAVDMVISLLMNNETGVPANPRATLIKGTWTEGRTVRTLR
jgi:DNA-binding LacI/PurR family transcriptional regulator